MKRVNRVKFVSAIVDKISLIFLNEIVFVTMSDDYFVKSESGHVMY